MKKENLLIGLLGVQLCFGLYHFPNLVIRLLGYLVNSRLDNLNDVLLVFFRFFFLAIGLIGLTRYVQKRNIYDPFLKVYFIHSVIMFFVEIPSIFYFLILPIATKIPVLFYSIKLLQFITIILVILIYRKEKVKVITQPVQENSTRFQHYLIDALFINILLFGYAKIHGYLLEGYYFAEEFTFVLLSYFLTIFYYTIAESIFQQTIGKVITKKYVRRMDGDKAGFWKVLIRTLARLIPFEAFSLLVPPPKGWHDSLSGTNVFERVHPREKSEDGDIIEHLTSEED